MRRLTPWIGAASVALVASACSPTPEEDPCEGVVCESGVCSAGECVNPSDCAGDSSACLPGYACNASDACAPVFACEDDGTCARGECADGACVNPEACAEDTDCTADSYCDDGACTEDLCFGENDTCERGVCERETGGCVNPETCSADTDCVDGTSCYDGTCSTDEQICDALDCQRGVCDATARACVDAQDCQGDDALCLDGDYCNGSTCEANACDADMVMCPRGECDPSAGECVNPDTCAASEDCLAMNECLAGACVPRAEACGAQGCEGNQECAYDAANLAAACAENSGGCTNANDCLGDRVCAGGQCADPSATCADDGNEENDDVANATTYGDALVGKSVLARACGDDADVYVVDTSDAEVPGQLVMELEIAREDVGLGQLELAITNDDGTVALGTAQTDADGKARLKQRISFATRLPYKISVRGLAGLSTDGVDYRLFAQVVPEPVVASCENSATLTEGMSETSTTLSGDSLKMSASCADSTGTIPEDTWLIELEESSFVTVTVTPQSGVDLAVSIREECVNAASEASCSNAGDEGGREVVTALLSAGTHAAIVQAPSSANTGGSYSISYTAAPTICGPDYATCADQDTAQTCSANGTSIVDVECGARGCDANTGRCARLDGDVCSQPVLVDASAGVFTGEVVWNDLSNAYAIAGGGCLEDDGNGGVLPVAGPDSAYQVTVPAGQAVRATLDYAGRDVALYAVTSCDALGTTCLSGQNTTTNRDETLYWRNEGATDQDLFIIADVTTATVYNSSDIEIEVAEVVCDPLAFTCGTNAGGDAISQECDAFGFGTASETVCNYGCDGTTGLCEPPINDACTGAIALTPGTPVTADIGDFVSDHPLATGDCTGFPTSGPDAVYSFTANQDDVVTVDFTSSFDGALWISESCDAGGQIGACLQGTDEVGANATEQLEFVAPAAGIYYVTGLAFTRTSGAFTLNVDVRPRECNPGDPFTCASANDLQFCNDRGLFESYTCQTTCTAGACDQPSGDLCIDPVQIAGPSGQLAAQNFGAKANNDIELDAGQSGGCFIDNNQRSDGLEDIFSIDLTAGDLLEVTLTTTATNAHLFLFEDCLRAETCLDNLPFQGGTGTVRHYADQNKTVTVVVDYRGTSAPTATYDLDWTVSQGSACVAGESFCQDGTTVARCSEDGNSIESTETCTAGCLGGGCQIDLAANDVCADVQAGNSIGSGITVYGTYDVLQNSVDMGPTNCTGGSTAGKDLLYKVTVPAGQLLRATAVSFGKESAVVYAFRDCADPTASCVAGSGEFGTPPSAGLLYLNTSAAAEDFIVGIDSRFSTADEPFGLDISVSPPECTPGTQQCATNGTDVEICGTFGLYSTTACANGCASNGCLTPDGGTCAESIELSRAGGTFSDVMWPAGNDSTLARGRSGACLIESTTSGREVFYRISLNAGEMLTAQVDTDYPDTHIYILPTCGAGDQCLSSTTGEGDGSTLVRYVAPTSQEVRVVVDTEDAESGDLFDLNWSIQPGKPCAPGQSRCVSATSVGVCDIDGIAETVYACDDACSDGACAANPTGRDLCADAATLPALIGGTVVYGSFSQFTQDDVELPSTGSCVSQATDGDDTFYQVTIPANDTLRATLTSYDGERMALYLIDDCANPDTTCEAGVVAPSSSEPAELVYKNTTGAQQTITLGVDSTDASANGDFALEVDIRPAECTPGQRVCSINGFDQKSCNNDGLFDAFTCNGTCSTTGCDTPTGDVCLDALTLSGLSGSVTGDWLNGSNQRNILTGETGACGIESGDDSDGREDFYRFALDAGDVLNVDLVTASSTAYMFVFKGCGPSESTCAYVNPLEADVLTKTYYAEESEEIIVMIDNTNTTSTFDDAYTLTWRISKGQLCAPNTARCIDDTTLAVCDNLNNQSLQTCTQGCNVSACNLDTAADACVAMNPTLVGDGIAVFGRYDDLSDNTVSLPSSGCAGSTSPGDDAFYAIELQPNEGAIAELQVYGNFEDPVLYAFTDCADASNTCVAGDGDLNSDSVSRIEFVNETLSPVTYYVAVDSDSSVANESFFLTITKQRPDCATTGLAQCATDNLTLQVCGADGFNDRYLCDGGCAGASCGQPRGEICADAIALSGASGSFQQMAWAGDSALTLETMNSGSCVLENGVSTDGPEAFYDVTLGAGDLLSATLSTGEADARMYLISDCADTSTCVAVTERSGAGELFFRSELGGNYTLVVDVEGSTSESYSLDYQIIPGFVCAPGTSRCVDAATVAICQEGGAAELIASCACADGTCAASVADTDVCADASAATDIGSGIVVRGNMDDLTETITIPSSGCAGVETDGHDAFYKVELTTGQSVIAKVRSLDNEDLALYAFTDCADAENTCLAGGNGGDDVNELVYSNTTGVSQTVFIALDSTSTTVDGDYELEIIRRDPECTTSQIECANDGNNIKLCSPQGFYDYFLCSGGCTLGNQCDNPTGEACYEAQVLSQLSGTLMGDFAGSNDLALPQGRSGACVIDDSTAAVTDGPDTFYQVTLSQNDLLSLNLVTENTNAELYILRGCGEEQCIENLTSPGSLSYFATEPQETIYIAVDSTTASDDTFELSYSIVTGVACEPGGGSCVNSTLLELCADDGSQVIGQVSCAGGCFEGRCELDVATAETCVDAQALGSVGVGISLLGDFSDLDDDVDLTGSSCVGSTTPGPDAFYRVDVPTGQVLVARVESLGGEAPRVYAFTDCANPTTSCLAGDSGSATQPAEARYLNTTGVSQSVFVGVDVSSGADEYFKLDIEVKSPNCTPGQRVCSPNGIDLSVCDSFGIFSEPFTCGGACSNGSCTMPLGDFCFDAIPVNPLGGPATFSDLNVDIDTQNNNMSIGNNACLGSTGDGDGEEKFYSALLAPGETVNAVMSTTDFEDMELYIITDCSQPALTCVSGPEAGGNNVTENQSYTNNTGAPQVVTIVADFDDVSAFDEFDITITVQ